MDKQQNTSNNNKGIIIIAGLLAFALMIGSYIIALAQFPNAGYGAPDDSSVIEESSEYSEIIEDESSTEVVEKHYEYYYDFQFESFPYRNSEVVNGSLAVIKDGSNGFPLIDQSKIVNIGQVKTENVYGLNNMSLVLYEEAISGIDKFLCSFFEQVPKNGLIINKGYLSSEHVASSDTVIDLTTGYSVQFSIYNSAYKFSDVEFSYLRDQAYKYGVIQRYPEGKREFTSHDADNTIYRYVGLAHSQYMNLYRYSLEEYLDKVRTEGVIEYKSELENNVAYVIYYVPLDQNVGTTYLPLPKGDKYSYSVSGDGKNGFVVSVKVTQ